jgi:hypothetical protein
MPPRSNHAPSQPSITPPQPVATARPFSDFPDDARRCEAAIYWFALAGSILKDGCKSLSEVFEKLPNSKECHISYSFLRLIPKHLAILLRKCFNRDVKVYLTPWANTRKIVGLTTDGLIALQLAVEYVNANHVGIVAAE